MLIRFTLSRILQGAFVVGGAILITFVLGNFMGNDVRGLVGTLATPEQVGEIEQHLGYDRPVPERFVHYVGQIAQGDFGTSFRSDETALSVVVDALPYTLLLSGAALLTALAIGLPLAITSAIHRDRAQDHLVRQLVVILQGIPEFWFGLMLTLVFSVTLGLFPSFGYDGPVSLVLPTIAVALPLLPIVVRLYRAELLAAMGMDFALSLRGRGFSDRYIVMRHATRCAMPNFVSVIGLQASWLIGGSIFVEFIFGWPGVGNLLITAVGARDLLIVQCIVILVAIAYVALNFLCDLLVLYLDPRIRLGSQ